MAAKRRLLLINPWIFDFTAFDLWSKPVGLLYVASYLRQVGYDIDFIDCLDRHHPLLLSQPGMPPPKTRKYGTGHFIRRVIPKPDVLRFVPRHFARYGIPEELFVRQLRMNPAPDAVLVTSFMTYWYMGPQRVIEIIRQEYPGIPVILGGIYATLLPDHARQRLKPDYVIAGPGERLAEKCLSGIFSDAPGPAYPPAALDDFPLPAFDLYDRLDYLPVMTSRGCPYRCTFCATDKISGPYAQRDPNQVAREITGHIQKFQVKDIAFYDDALLLNKHNRLIPLLEVLIRSGISARFHTPNGLHARQIDPELARLFHRSGFTTIRLSFETIDENRRKDMRDKITPDELAQAVINLEMAGYTRKSLEAYVLMGLPGQPFEEIYRSILFVHSLGIKVRLASYSPIPGTEDYQRAVRYGLFPADADPLLMNKSLYPLHRTKEAFHEFDRIKQLTNSLNRGAEKGENLLDSRLRTFI